jgi:hypothetical protein
MVQWIAFMLLTGCMVAQVPGAPAQNQEVPQSQPSEQSQAEKLEGAKSTTGFPLDQFQEFSAIMVGSVLSGDDREAHIYRSGPLLRTQGTEGLGYFLTDLTSFDTYGLTRLGCTRDTHMFFRAFPFSAGRPNRKIERVDAGKESMNGHMCQVEEVTVSGGDLALPIKMKFWEAEDLHGFPVRVQVLNGKGRGIIQYKDVVLGPADPSLFMLPARCSGDLPQPPKKSAAKKKSKTAAKH